MKILVEFLFLQIAMKLSNAEPCDFTPPCPTSCDCREAVTCYGDDTTDTLYLCNLGLSQVPTFEGTYSSLTKLVLSGNTMSRLEPNILTYITFPSLTKLSLSGNRIREIDDEILQLPTLLELDLSYNQLTSLDFLVGGYMSELLTLDLTGNAISHLKPEILTYVTFPHLTKLSLRGNGIRRIDDEVIKLPTLEELDLSNNQLTSLDFLAFEESVSRSVTVYVAGNPLICEELADVEELLCGAEMQQNDRANCTSNTGSELLITDFCRLSSNGDQPNGGGGGLAAVVGGTVGGIAVVVISLLVLVVVVFICLKAGTDIFNKVQVEVDTEESSVNKKSQSSFQSHQQSSVHSAPPSFPPIPPPLDIPPRPARPDEIYAEVMESPVTATSVLSRDYEDGYILNVESVPNKSRKTFGTFVGAKSAPLPPILAPLPPIPARDYDIARCVRQQRDREEAVPLEPTPYHTIPIADIRPRSQSEKISSSRKKKKPPIAPRKKSLKSLEEEDGRDRSASVGTHLAWRREEMGISPSRVGGARGTEHEADYMKVVL